MNDEHGWSCFLGRWPSRTGDVRGICGQKGATCHFLLEGSQHRPWVLHWRKSHHLNVAPGMFLGPGRDEASLVMECQSWPSWWGFINPYSLVQLDQPSQDRSDYVFWHKQGHREQTRPTRSWPRCDTRVVIWPLSSAHICGFLYGTLDQGSYSAAKERGALAHNCWTVFIFLRKSTVCWRQITPKRKKAKL